MVSGKIVLNLRKLLDKISTYIAEEGIEMMCPYCNEEMQKGEIQCRQGGMIYWQPREVNYGITKKRYSKRGVQRHGGIVLSPHQMYVISKPLIAYHCPSCKKVVIDY